MYLTTGRHEQPSGRFRNGARIASLMLTLLLATACTPQALRPDRQADLFALRQQADQDYGDHHYEKALVAYRQLADRVPRDALIWFRLGNTHARLGQYPEAAAAYQRALARDPDLARAAYNLGVVRLHQALLRFQSLAQQAGAGDPLRALALRQAERLQAVLDGETDDEGTP